MLAGPMRLAGSIKQPLVAQNGHGVTGYALTGVITSATWQDLTPTWEECELVFSRNGPNGYEIVAGNPLTELGDGSVRNIGGVLPGPAYSLQCSPNGNWVYFIRNNNLQRINVTDGTSNTLIANVGSFSLTPDGTKVVCSRFTTNEVFVANANGSGVTSITTPANPLKVAGCLSNGQAVLWEAGYIKSIDLLPGALPVIRTITPAGNYVCVSMNGQNIYAWTINGAERWFFRYYPSPTGSYGVSLLGIQNSLIYSFGALSPDAQVGAFVGGVSPSQTFGLYVDSLYPGARTFLQGAQEIYSVAWTPLVRSRPMIGAGSSFPTGAGALLYCGLGARVPAAVIADGTSNTIMVAEQVANGTSGDFVYNISCDQLKRLSYARGNGYRWIDIISSPSGIRGAIVAFDATTGALNNVVTYTRKPSIERTPSGIRLEGELVESLDLKTGNMAPASRTISLK